MRTVPASPSTSTTSPSSIAVVAVPAPTTAGIPYSRATTAQWLRMPPVSVTTAAATANSGVHGGAVVSATRISPGFSRAASASERTTRATPVTVPGEPADPLTTPGSASGAGTPENFAARRVNGLSGGGPGGIVPSIGGTATASYRASAVRRPATR